jgi:RNase H-like domain found in reverse transcriptase
VAVWLGVVAFRFFFQEQLSTTESHYSAFDRELLAVYSSLLQFRHMLEGKRFTVFMDHNLLVGALTHISEPKSDRQQRQLSAIAELTTNIGHITGPTNVVADTLSRPPPVLSCDVVPANCGGQLGVFRGP